MYYFNYNYSQVCKSARGHHRLLHGKSRSGLHNKNKYIKLMITLKPDTLV